MKDELFESGKEVLKEIWPMLAILFAGFLHTIIIYARVLGIFGVVYSEGSLGKSGFIMCSRISFPG